MTEAIHIKKLSDLPRRSQRLFLKLSEYVIASLCARSIGRKGDICPYP